MKAPKHGPEAAALTGLATRENVPAHYHALDAIAIADAALELRGIGHR